MIQGISPQIESILAAGNQAPSGENSQPWKFIVKGEHIEVHIVSERDESFYNWGQRASYMAIGAAIENMAISASTLGYKSTIELFPPGEITHVATLALTADPAVRHDTLAEQVLLRVTNRKRYLPMRLSEAERKAMQDSIAEIVGCSLHITDEKSDILRLAAVGSANEEIMLSNEKLHSFFFSHINWTQEEDDQKKIGFFIKTLELPAPAIAAFFVIKNWSVMKMFLNFGFASFIGKQNAATYAASGAIGAISISSDEPKDFVQAGRAMERVWLTATRLGMSIQPLTGILFFKLKMDKGEQDVFSADEQRRINEEYDAIRKIYDAAGKRIVFMFRMGSGATPSARSSRFSLDKVVNVLP